MRTVISASNPVYADPNNTSIYLDVVFKELGPEPVPFLATADDRETHGWKLHVAATNGAYGLIAPYVAPDAAKPS